MVSKLLVLVLALGIYAQAQADAPLSAPFTAAYMPVGFDSNDNAEIVVEGNLPASCYRVQNPEVSVNRETHEIRLQAQGMKVNGYCFVMPMPFTQTVSLGLLPVGDYQVRDWSGQWTYGTLKVALPRAFSQDDYIYASVNQASVQPVNGKTSVVISGTFPGQCMHLGSVLVSVQTNVIVVQPILVQDSMACGPAQEFQVSEPLSPDVHGRFLIHVRSAVGTAFNALVNVSQ